MRILICSDCGLPVAQQEPAVVQLSGAEQPTDNLDKGFGNVYVKIEQFMTQMRYITQRYPIPYPFLIHLRHLPSHIMILTMQLPSISVIAIFVSATLALAHDFPPWTPPASGDVRSPCPALNTLANHGIIPHDGRGLSIRMLQKAIGNTYNIGIDLSTAFSLFGMTTASRPWTGKFDLSDLGKHNMVEHDASLSRDDAQVSGDPVTFRPDIWAQVLEEWQGMTNATIETAARARAKRVSDAKAQNPEITYGKKVDLLSYGETALYLSAMGDVNTGIAPVDWINVWFSKLFARKIPLR